MSDGLGWLGFLKILQWSPEQCREYLERQRWPDGPRCPKCGAEDPYKIIRQAKTKNVKRTLYKCRACRRQFTATVGTILEASHIPLNKWFAAIYLMCASKKGISAHQIHRQLGVTYKSAWFMCHRIREAMRDKAPRPLSGTVEADEVYIGGRQRGHPVWRERINDEIRMGWRERPKTHPRLLKTPVLGILERGGRVRTLMPSEVRALTVQPVLLRNIDLSKTRLITDGNKVYALIRKHGQHDVIDHEVQYVRGDVHIQGIENYWSLLKRGVFGVFHHVSARHLPMYLSEFEFRFNRRKTSDAERFAFLMGQTRGRVLWYCRTPQLENPHA